MAFTYVDELTGEGEINLAKTMNETELLSFLDKIHNESNSRYNSWRYCYQAFEDLDDKQNDDLLALNLAFYLASWGMYRGSSGLLQKDYKVHNPAIELLRNFRDLRCNSEFEISLVDHSNIINLVSSLKVYYGQIEYIDPQGEICYVTPTDTLISKIILGTLGCLPAFDRYFMDGVKSHLDGVHSINSKSLDTLIRYMQYNSYAIKAIQKSIYDKYNMHYPAMKIIDLFFWNEGYKKELELTAM